MKMVTFPQALLVTNYGTREQSPYNLSAAEDCFVAVAFSTFAKAAAYRSKHDTLRLFPLHLEPSDFKGILRLTETLPPGDGPLLVSIDIDSPNQDRFWAATLACIMAAPEDPQTEIEIAEYEMVDHIGRGRVPRAT